MSLSREIEEKIELLREKYAASGQDMLSYLEGLIYQDFLNYWDYINLDVLLNIQQPRTHFPDETVFIVYHQITELYFKLTLHAMKQITDTEQPDPGNFKTQLKRMNDYFKNLIRSYEIMVDGMDKEQFLKFRMSLLPASGFQSAQYRFIEILSTDARNLLSHQLRNQLGEEENLRILYENFYWKQGGKELRSGKKTLTLRQFEKKYSEDFIKALYRYEHDNLWQKFKKLPEEAKDVELIKQLKDFDLNVEVRWPLMHYRSAVRYLHKKPEDIEATGGTNWQEYLPPHFQKTYLFPELFSEKEKESWGKSRITRPEPKSH